MPHNSINSPQYNGDAGSIARNQIAHNRAAHDEIVADYDNRHSEIYNPVEQKRIETKLKHLVALLDKSADLSVLDFGAGTGNLTRHLLGLGIRVTAADVSPKMLEQLARNASPQDRLSTVSLNGIDLREFPDNSFDATVTYSVLHHVPDYLAIVSEFQRVTRTGGLIYIDHEAAPGFWKWNSSYNRYLKQLSPGSELRHWIDIDDVPRWVRMPYTLGRLRKLFDRGAWDRLLRRIVLSRKPLTGIVNEEGDIHVFKHDHIEWKLITDKLSKTGDIVEVDDYLLCRERTADAPVWNRWKDKCVDMRCMIFRKI